MAIFQVKYMVPVWVEVNTDEREVVSVHVMDEETGEPVEVADESLLPVPGGPEASLASDLAESGEWPAWEFGW